MIERLRQRADFLAAANGLRAPTSGFVLQALDRREDRPVRVGFTVSKKVGNAVERNRVRRRLREVVRLTPQAPLRPGHDYVLIGRRGALELPFERLVEDFTRALGRVHSGSPGTGGSGRGTGRGTAATPDAGTKQSAT
jgi:ribonuclease P protein component